MRIGGPDFEARTGAVCAEVGIDEKLLRLPFSALSGGQAARAGLASTLLSRFDVLLLDEPTNDLDFEGLSLLESYCSSRHDRALVIVSHDRAFLERTITAVLEIDDNHHSASYFDGGWDAFLREREVERSHAQDRYSDYVVQRNALRQRAQQQRQWATKGVKAEKDSPRDKDKMQAGFRVDRTERLAGKARATQKAIDRLDVVEKPWEGWRLQLELESSGRPSDVIAYLRDAVVELGDFTIGPLDYELRWQDRVAIVGPNGAGKTTFVRTLLGELPLVSGERFVSSSMVVGMMDQQRLVFETSRPLVDVFVRETGMLISEARSLLAKFRLGAEHIMRPASSLSPGEKTRAVLASISAAKANVLVLDEPTNHLDIEAIEQLELALQGYEGTLLLISHDRALLDAVEVRQTIAFD